MSVRVVDPFEAAGDPALPSLPLALDPVGVTRRLQRRVPRLAGAGDIVSLSEIRVVRHKPGRRCVIEYDVRVERPAAPAEALTLIGKIRVRRHGAAAYRLLDSLWEAGFSADSPDLVSVAEPIGHVARLRMWLQRKVPGVVATELLAGPGGPALARRIAEAANKLHEAGVPAEKRHTMADELRLLHDRLGLAAQAEPRLATRIARVLDASVRLGGRLREPVLRGIHRDFYGDQVIVEGERLHLIDFDEYCVGDPALDIGNFMGALTEQSLRELADPTALVVVEQALEQRFVELSGEATRAAVGAYSTLTLVRQIYLSTVFPERRRLTAPLLELCEERLGLGQRSERFFLRR